MTEALSQRLLIDRLILRATSFGVGSALKVAVAILSAAFLSACVSMPSGTTGAPPIVKDGGPDRDLDVSHIPDAIPRVEVRTRAGNSNPYSVLGKTYYLVDNPTGFRQQGEASWYGTKFHGQRTANGEIYDMYGMTAAHTTLPIPSYVRVTNKRNGKSVVVRINDRGPFHNDRIIDLTYTAAKKLGFVQQGTAPVEIEYLEPEESPLLAKQPVPPALAATTPGGGSPATPTPVNSAGYAIPENTFLQVGAFGSLAAAQGLQQRLEQLTDYPVVITTAAVDSLMRVRIGPFKDSLDLMNVRQILLDRKFSEPHVVYD